eukprot:1710646-Rhodomonas_salina.1
MLRSARTYGLGSRGRGVEGSRGRGVGVSEWWGGGVAGLRGFGFRAQGSGFMVTCTYACGSRNEASTCSLGPCAALTAGLHVVPFFAHSVD